MHGIRVEEWKKDLILFGRYIGALYMSRPDFKPLPRFKAGQLDRFKVIHKSTNLSILVSICDNYHAL